MASKCPHCAEPIEALSGFVSDEKLKERLDAQKKQLEAVAEAKAKEIDVLASELQTLRPRVEGYESIVKERDTLKGEVSKLSEGLARDRALMPVLASIDDEKAREEVRHTFDVIYASKFAGKEGEEVVPFTELDKWAREHIALKPFFGERSAAAPANAQPAAAEEQKKAGTNTLPRVAPGAQPPSTGEQVTADKLRAWMRSPEAVAMKPEERRARAAEMRTQHEQQMRTP